jgi:Alpha-(1->3)-arabinofuranosyltransferase
VLAFALAFGLLFGGLEGLLIAAGGVLLTAWRGPRLVIGASAACLAAAVVLVLTEASLTTVYDSFAVDRPIAAAAARAAGILAMVAILAFAERERDRMRFLLESALPRSKQVPDARDKQVLTAQSNRIWLLALTFAAVALVAVFTNSRGRYITDLLLGDNHFSLFWNPGELLGRQQSLWDPLHGLGRTRNNFWPVPTGFMWLIRSVGVPAIVAQRLWHAAILAAAGIGMAVLLRQFRPRVGTEHAVSGLVYMFVPISAVTLHSSYFLLSYGLAPWFATVFLRGVRTERPWRWAAVFALLFFVPGNPNYASLLYALIPVAFTAIYVVHIERSTRWRDVMAWIGRALLLSAIVSAAGLVTTHYEADVVAANLNQTELAEHTAQNSSWFESLRGLGWWLVYFRISRVVALHQFAPYFTSWPAILTSVAVPLLAFVTLGWNRARERLLFGLLTVVGAAIVVGGFPPDSPPPFGELLFRTFDALPSLKGFRGTYKAGAVLALGLAGLLGIGVAALSRRLPTRRWKFAAAIVAVIAFCTATFPFWTGSLYRTKENLTAIPQHYRDATAWLDRQSGEGRVLILPSTIEAVYTWGAAGDDIFDSLLERPHIVRAQVDAQMGTAQAANLLAAVDDYVNSGEYQAGALAPIARRLGIRYVMLRNDLDWAAIHRPAPSNLDALRNDPELHLRAAFGRPGQGVKGGKSARARQADADRPPVEIFEVDGVDALARVSQGPELLVSGDGRAWPTLARTGFLSTGAPVRYTGDLPHEDLARALENGAGVVVTDTNLRRVQSIPGASDLASSSPLLTDGESVYGREVQDLFGRRNSESVAWYPDGMRISASGRAPFAAFQPAAGPANAFDGVDLSSWAAGGYLEDPTGEWVRADFKSPHDLDRLRIVRAATGTRVVTKVRLDFSDGSRVSARITGAAREVTFPPRTTRWVRLTITGVHGSGTRPVGIAEIGIPGINLRQQVQLPTDVVDAATEDPELGRLLAGAPLTYQFTRLGRVTPTGFPVEFDLHRRVRTPFAAEYTLTGIARLRPGGSTAPAPGECRNDIVYIDNSPVAARIDADISIEPQGNADGTRSVRFVACGPVELGPGWHYVDNVAGTGVDTVSMSTGPPLRPAARDSARTMTRTGGDVTVRAHAQARSAVVIGESYDPSWRGQVGGRGLGPPIALDTQTAWNLPGDGLFTLDADFGPERAYTAGLIVTGFGVLLCLVLALLPDRARSWMTTRARGRRSTGSAGSQT